MSNQIISLSRCSGRSLWQYVFGKFVADGDIFGHGDRPSNRVWQC
ncbi:hypothetical protein GGD50_003237 [Rhizobium paranaense]|uniref:Uncharacterized protein n=1 Tax=Rhizobium paranaense TaxID=1650438 RepID=A0A7W9D211_9HYPH|nr:hypothetical protein [Rhizobium paranaense]